MKTLKQFKKEAFKRTGVRRAYEKLEPELRIIETIALARIKHQFTQRELATKIGVAQSALARFEAGRTNPTLSFLNKVTSGLGLKLVVK